MPQLPIHRSPALRRKIVGGRTYAVVTLNGCDVILGRLPDRSGRAFPPEVVEKYKAVIGQWEAAGRLWQATAAERTVRDLVAAYRVFAERFYVEPDGTPSGELHNYKDACKPLLRLAGDKPISKFSSLVLEELQQAMINLGWCRTYINRQIGRVRRIFKWGVAKHLVPVNVLAELKCVDPLPRRKSGAVEHPEVEPVDPEHARTVLPFVDSRVAAMLQLQMLTGMRSGELCSLRGIDLDTSGAAWVYSPAQHKTEHHGKARPIVIGPRGQAILQPMLSADVQSRVFAPYDSRSYARAIARACKRAWPPPAHLDRKRVEIAGRKHTRWETRTEWEARLTSAEREELETWHREHHFHPHQVRHTVCTEIANQFDDEHASAVLGHSHVRMTRRYIRDKVAKASKIALAIG